MYKGHYEKHEVVGAGQLRLPREGKINVGIKTERLYELSADERLIPKDIIR